MIEWIRFRDSVDTLLGNGASQGQLTLEMITQVRINLQPAVIQAGDTCVSVSHGQITKGDVAQAVANPSVSGSQSSTSG